MQEIKFGFYLTNNLFNDNMIYSIPLKHISFNTEITNNIVKTVIKQTYLNNSIYFIEAEYLFPIWSNACFDSFEAALPSFFLFVFIKKLLNQIKKSKE